MTCPDCGSKMERLTYPDGLAHRIVHSNETRGLKLIAWLVPFWACTGCERCDVS